MEGKKDICYYSTYYTSKIPSRAGRLIYTDFSDVECALQTFVHERGKPLSKEPMEILISGALTTPHFTDSDGLAQVVNIDRIEEPLASLIKFHQSRNDCMAFYGELYFTK